MFSKCKYYYMATDSVFTSIAKASWKKLCALLFLEIVRAASTKLAEIESRSLAKCNSTF